MMRGVFFWLVWNVPLGPLAPWIFGLAMGRMPHKKEARADD
jgi:hypothetical protein